MILMLDLAVSALLVLLAAGALYAPTNRGGVILFVAFGLVLSLIWVRLEAADLALAEAAIGAGLTGVLLFTALAADDESTASALPLPRRLLGLAFCSAVLALVLVSLWSGSDGASELPALAMASLEVSGVSHPVTAVLLNFRAWDTLLELLVLLLALLGSRQLRPSGRSAPESEQDRGHRFSYAEPPELLLAWGRTLTPLLILGGIYLLWRGSTQPGGAFQAGAVLAAGAVMLRLNHLLPPLNWSLWYVRLALVTGLVAFLLTALLTAFAGNGLLDYPRAYDGLLILLVETSATLSIAVTLTLLVAGESREFRS